MAVWVRAVRTKTHLCLCALLLLSACAGQHQYQRPNKLIPDAHAGGTVVAIGPDSRRLASGGLGGWVRLWSLADGKELSSHPAHRGGVTAIGFLRIGGGLVTTGYDSRLILWDATGRQRSGATSSSPIKDMVIDEAAGRVITGHKDGMIRTWRLSGLDLLEEWPAHGGPVRALAWHAASRRLASSGEDGRVIIWSDAIGPRALSVPPSDARTLAFSADGRELYGAGWFRLYRWEIETGRLTTLATDHWGIINAIQLMPDGTLASISRQTDSAVLLLDPRTGGTVERFQSHALCGSDVAVSPDGRYLATTSDDASVRIWDLHNPLSRR